MISWHLLYEQLKNNPELMEEEAALDNIAVNSELDIPRQGESLDQQQEQQALRKLQSRLGNAGMQKLIKLQQSHKTATPAKKPSKAVGQAQLNSGKNNAPASLHNQSAVATAPSLDTAKDKPEEVVAAENSQLSASDSVELDSDKTAIEQTSTIQPEVEAQLRQGMDLKVTPDQATSDTRKLQEKQLQLFISHLPAPSASLWKQASDVFLLLDKSRQQHFTQAIVSYVRTASRPLQGVFFQAVQQLPASLRQQFFVSNLLQQLLAVLTSLQTEPEVEPPPPEEPSNG